VIVSISVALVLAMGLPSAFGYADGTSAPPPRVLTFALIVGTAVPDPWTMATVRMTQVAPRTVKVRVTMLDTLDRDAVIAKRGSLAQRATCSSSGGNWMASRANSSVASVGDPSDLTRVRHAREKRVAIGDSGRPLTRRVGALLPHPPSHEFHGRWGLVARGRSEVAADQLGEHEGNGDGNGYESSEHGHGALLIADDR